MLSPLLWLIIVGFVVLPLILPDPDVSPSLEPLTSIDLSLGVKSMVMSADGSHLAATCRDRPIAIFDRDSVEPWRAVNLGDQETVGYSVLAFSPDGITLAGGNIHGTVSVWGLGTSGTRSDLFKQGISIRALAFSPDGTTLACAHGDSRILLWDVSKGQERRTLKGHSGPVVTLSFSPDGAILASGGEDHTVRLWDMRFNRPPLVAEQHKDVVLTVAFSQCGDMLASTALGEHGIRLWDSRTADPQGFLDSTAQSIVSLAFVPDTKCLAAGDDHGDVAIYYLPSKCVWAILHAHQGWVKSLAVEPDGKSLVSGGSDGLVKVWDISRKTHPL